MRLSLKSIRKLPPRRPVPPDALAPRPNRTAPAAALATYAAPWQAEGVELNPEGPGA